MTRMPRQRGVALLLVMWLIMLLAGLIGAFALIARTEHLQGRVQVRGLVAENAARGRSRVTERVDLVSKPYGRSELADRVVRLLQQ